MHSFLRSFWEVIIFFGNAYKLNKIYKNTHFTVMDISEYTNEEEEKGEKLTTKNLDYKTFRIFPLFRISLFF